MADNDKGDKGGDKVKVVIGFDPTDRSREGKTVSLPASEAHSLVYGGRAQYADAEADPGRNKAPGTAGNTNNAAS